LIKVLLVDDHHIVREGIKRLLSDASDIEIVAEAASGEEALKLARENAVDVVLMDVQMPGIGGIEATRKIIHYHPKVKVLVLTVCDDDIFPTRLLRSGASGYVTKGSPADELLQAIHEVYAGERYLSPRVAQQLALKRFDDKSSPFDHLSERELQVLLMITQGQKVQTISSQLHLSPKTVNTYRYRIFAKLGVKSDVELTHLALRYGIIGNQLQDQDDTSE